MANPNFSFVLSSLQPDGCALCCPSWVLSEEGVAAAWGQTRGQLAAYLAGKAAPAAAVGTRHDLEMPQRIEGLPPAGRKDTPTFS